MPPPDLEAARALFRELAALGPAPAPAAQLHRGPAGAAGRVHGARRALRVARPRPRAQPAGELQRAAGAAGRRGSSRRGSAARRPTTRIRTGFVRGLFHSRERGSNWFRFNSKLMDELLERSRRTGEPRERARVFAEIDDLIAQEAPAVPVWSRTYRYYVGNHVQGLELSYSPVPLPARQAAPAAEGRVAMSVRAVVMEGPGRPLELHAFDEPRPAPGGAVLETVLSRGVRHRRAPAPRPARGRAVPDHPRPRQRAAACWRRTGRSPTSRAGRSRPGRLVTFYDVFGICGAVLALPGRARRHALPAPAGVRHHHQRRRRPARRLGASASSCGPACACCRCPTASTRATFMGGGCGLPTGFHAVERAGIALGDTVVVQGSGPVGPERGRLRVARGRGRACWWSARPRRASRPRAGWARTTCSTSRRRRTRTRACAGCASAPAGRGADVVIEASGNPRRRARGPRDGARRRPLRRGRAVHRRGRRHAQPAPAPEPPARHAARLLGLRVHATSTARSRMMARHRERFRWRELVTREYALEDAGAGARGHGGAGGGEGGHRAAPVTADAPAAPPRPAGCAASSLPARAPAVRLRRRPARSPPPPASAGAALFWIARHALAVHRLTARRRRHDVLLRRRPAVVPARRAAPRRPAGPDRAVAAPGRGRGRGPPLLPPPRASTPSRFGRAVVHNLRARRACEGGSTLTQQLARTLFLSNRRTLRPQGQGGGAGPDAGAAAHQGPDPRAVPEPRLPRAAASTASRPCRGSSSRKRAQDLEPGRVGARRRPHPRARPRCRPGPTRTGARARSHVVLRAHARGGLHHAARRSRRPRPRAAAHHRAARALADARSGYAKEFLRQQFRERVGDDHPPDWQVHTTFLPAVQEAAERAVARRPAALGMPGPAGARWSPSTRRRATSWPWWAGATSAPRPFNRAVRSRRQPGSAFKPFVYAAALERGLSPGHRAHRPARGDRAADERGVDAAQRERRGARRGRRCARRCSSRTTRPRSRCSSRSAPAPCCGLAATRRAARPARRAVAGPGHRPRDAAGADRRLRRRSPTAATR